MTISITWAAVLGGFYSLKQERAQLHAFNFERFIFAPKVRRLVFLPICNRLLQNVREMHIADQVKHELIKTRYSSHLLYLLTSSNIKTTSSLNLYIYQDPLNCLKLTESVITKAFRSKF